MHTPPQDGSRRDGGPMSRLAARSQVLCRENRRLLAETRRRAVISRRWLNRAFGMSGSSEATMSSDGWADSIRSLVRDKLTRGALFVLAGSWSSCGGAATGQPSTVSAEPSNDGTETAITTTNGTNFANHASDNIWQTENTTCSHDP